MSLRDTWVKAKAASKVEFSKACKTKKDDLAKRAQGGNAAAQAKWVEKALGEMGLDDVEEPEKFFKFKSDFGPSLDKVEKNWDSYAKVLAMRAKITPKVLTSDPKLAAQAAAAMKDTPSVAKILTMFATDTVPAVVKNNPATMKKTQDTLALHDIAARMIPAPDKFHEAMLAAIAAAEEYTRVIQASYKRWPDAKPDFRKSLIDALNEIEKTIGDRIKAAESGAG
jgi:hypothetical protein